MDLAQSKPFLETTQNSSGDSVALGEAMEGVGLHTGRRFRVRLLKAQHGEFLRFVGCDTSNEMMFETPALWTRLSGTARATALVMRSSQTHAERSSRCEIKTIEHFMAAYLVMGLRGYDLHVESLDALKGDDAFELPILDGASLKWMEWLRACLDSQTKTNNGLVAPKERPVWIVARSFEIQDSFKRVLLLPHENKQDACTRFHCSVDFFSKWAQQMSFDLDWRQIQQSSEAFKKQISPARTFGFEHELKELEKRGLAMGGSLDNALLLNHERVVNEGGFCVPEELAAHKLLDAIGDFALLGAPLVGRIELQCAGHAMHLRALTEAVRKGVLMKGVLDVNGTLSLAST